MSVSHCMHHALAIAELPADAWPERIERLPEACTRPDCGAPHNCRTRVAEYLRVQWRMRQLRARRSAGKP